MNHHYVPQFYLRSWTGTDERLFRYHKTPRGRLVQKKCSPRSTAFEPDLYTLCSGVHPQGQENIIETEVMGRIDDDAAPVLRKLAMETVAAVELTNDERTGWACFLNALLVRHRSYVVTRDRAAPQAAETALTRLRGRERTAHAFSRFIPSADPDDAPRGQGTLPHEDEIRQVVVRLAQDTAREHMVRELRNVAAIDVFKNLTWVVVDAVAPNGFITTDAPLLLDAGLFEHETEPTLVTFPLTPNKLFVAHASSWHLDDELRKLLHTISQGHNRLLVNGSPCRSVYAHQELDSELKGLLERTMLTGDPGAS